MKKIVTFIFISLFITLISATTPPAGSANVMRGKILAINYSADYPNLPKQLSVSLQKENTSIITERYDFLYFVQDANGSEANRILAILMSAKTNGDYINIHYESPVNRGDGYNFGRIRYLAVENVQ